MIKFYFRIILIAISFTTLTIENGVAFAQPPNCTSNEELLNLNGKDIEGITACDSTGAMFLLGFGKNFKTVYDSTSTKHGYYYYVRKYINFRSFEQREWNEDAFSYLLLADIFLPGIVGVGNPDHTRETYYSAFILSEFWQLNLHISNETKRIYRDFLKAMLDLGPFNNIPELRCFIQYDIPTINLETVLQSRNYLTCLKEII